MQWMKGFRIENPSEWTREPSSYQLHA